MKKTLLYCMIVKKNKLLTTLTHAFSSFIVSCRKDRQKWHSADSTRKFLLVGRIEESTGLHLSI